MRVRCTKTFKVRSYSKKKKETEHLKRIWKGSVWQVVNSNNQADYEIALKNKWNKYIAIPKRIFESFFAPIN